MNGGDIMETETEDMEGDVELAIIGDEMGKWARLSVSQEPCVGVRASLELNTAQHHCQISRVGLLEQRRYIAPD